MREFRLFTTFLILSLWLHVMMGVGVSQLDGLWLDIPRRTRSVVELIEMPKTEKDADLKLKQFNKEQQFVRQAEVPDQEKTDIDLKARFFSERMQRVLIETQAKLSGLTANRNNTNMKSERKSNSKDFSPRLERQFPLVHPSAIGDLPIAKRFSPTDPGYLSRVDLSTVGERLPADIKTANITALNADAYLYYSFYSRLEELIRPRWVQHTHDAIESNPIRARQFSRAGELLCSYEFVLDKDGKFLRAIALNLSGFDGFDQAIVQTFRDVGRIPNPPKDLIREDGTVRLPLQLSAILTPVVARD